MFSRKNHVQISEIAICTVALRFRRRIDYPLNCFRCFILTYNLPHDLPWFPAYHHNHIDVLTRFCPRLNRNQYSSSSSNTSYEISSIGCVLAIVSPFFYPIDYIGFVHVQDLPNGSCAHSCKIHFDRQLSGFFRVLMPLWLNRVIYAALLTLAALTSRFIVPCLYLVLYLSTLRAFFPCLFCLFSHTLILSYFPLFVYY